MIILSIGSNLSSKFGDRHQNLLKTISLLEKKGAVVEKKSSIYETPSYPDKTKPKFLNMIILVKNNLTLSKLMSFIIEIENKFQRKRDKKNDPRTCDIDIIDFNSEIINLKHGNLELTVPHKNLASRNFVLFPLIEVMPKWIHPKTKESVSSLILKLSIENRKSILKIRKN